MPTLLSGAARNRTKSWKFIRRDDDSVKFFRFGSGGTWKAARQKTEPFVSLSQTWCSLFSRTW